MGMIFGLIGRLILAVSGISLATSVMDVVDFADKYSDEIEAVAEAVSEYEDPEDFFNNSVILSKEEYEELVAKADSNTTAEIEDADTKDTDEKVKAEEEAKKEEEDKLKADEEAKKKAEEAAAKKAEEEAAKEAEEAKAKEEADKKAAEEEAAKKAEEAAKKKTEKEAAPKAPAGKEVVSKVYMEDCGQDTGYWVITYSDGSVEYIDE